MLVDAMSREELLSEALTELIAGSDTVGNTACAIFYWILDGERKAPGTVVPRLGGELDVAIPTDADIASFKNVKNLPSLRRCIDEAMRLHSNSAIGLPRIVTSSK
jgi:benzoate 4-monooxygenase